jgi:phosphatidate cytidylyltransferase
MSLPESSSLIALALFIESGFVLGIIGTWLAARKADRETKRARWLKLGVYFVVVHACLLIPLAGPLSIAIFFAVIVVPGGAEILGLRAPWSAKTLALVLWLAGAAGGLFFFIPRNPGWFIWVYAEVAVLDAYSQITGQLFGKHKLAPTISPAKTWEGAVGGSICAVFAGWVLRDLVGLTWLPALGLGITIAVTAVLSDLLAAKYKRLAAVKDYGRLIPGHGGAVDRFNSFFGVALVLGLLSFFL